MLSPVEVLSGVLLTAFVSSFAAVRMHYASRDRPDSRLLRVGTPVLFLVGPVLGGYVTGVLLPTHVDAMFPYAPTLSWAFPFAAVCALVHVGGWNLAEWLRTRHREQVRTLPIARVVTLPPREPDDAGFWCTACRAPHGALMGLPPGWISVLPSRPTPNWRFSTSGDPTSSASPETESSVNKPRSPSSISDDEPSKEHDDVAVA